MIISSLNRSTESISNKNLDAQARQINFLKQFQVVLSTFLKEEPLKMAHFCLKLMFLNIFQKTTLACIWQACACNFKCVLILNTCIENIADKKSRAQACQLSFLKQFQDVLNVFLKEMSLKMA